MPSAATAAPWALVTPSVREPAPEADLLLINELIWKLRRVRQFGLKVELNQFDFSNTQLAATLCKGQFHGICNRLAKTYIGTCIG